MRKKIANHTIERWRGIEVWSNRMQIRCRPYNDQEPSIFIEKVFDKWIATVFDDKWEENCCFEHSGSFNDCMKGLKLFFYFGKGR